MTATQMILGGHSPELIHWASAAVHGVNTPTIKYAIAFDIIRLVSSFIGLLFVQFRRELLL